MSQHSELIAFAVALLASLGLTVPIRQLALRYGMVDKPGPRKVHLNPIPLLGGIAIYLGFILAVLLTRHDAPLQQIIGILAGATLLALVGFLDDGGLLHHQVKLFVGMPLAAVFLIASGIRAQLFSQFIPGLRRIGSGLVPYGFVGRGHHRRVQHSGSYGRPVRRDRRGGRRVFHHFGVRQRADHGFHSGRRDFGRSARVSALEFQSGEDFYG